MTSQEPASLPEITTGNSGEAQTQTAQTQTQIQTAQSTDVVVKPTGKKTAGPTGTKSWSTPPT
jgi:hypothetical protein